MVRKLSLILFAVIVVLGLAFVAYRHASPKIVLVNESSGSYDELIVNLPSSRVSFGPVLPNESATIYFSHQAVDGVATLGLISDGNTVSEGEFAYNRERQWGHPLAQPCQQAKRVCGDFSPIPVPSDRFATAARPAFQVFRMRMKNAVQSPIEIKADSIVFDNLVVGPWHR